MKEFQELVKDAPNFVSMERGKLVAYAYAMYAAGAKTDAENAKLRSTLRALIAGTNAELCADRDYPDCKECLMNRDRENCTVTDAMELLGCNAYGEPMGEVDG